MIYDLSNPHDIKKLKTKLNHYAEKGKSVDMKVYSPVRSSRQNSYLHLLLAAFAIEYGDRMLYVKQEIFKKIVNPDLFAVEFINQKSGEVREDWKSTKDLTTAEMSQAIERFKDYAAAELGLYLPDANQKREIDKLDIHVKNNQYW